MIDTDTDLALETMAVTAKAIAAGDTRGLTSLTYDLARDLAKNLMAGRGITAVQRTFLLKARARCTVDA